MAQQTESEPDAQQLVVDPQWDEVEDSDSAIGETYGVQSLHASTASKVDRSPARQFDCLDKYQHPRVSKAARENLPKLQHRNQVLVGYLLVKSPKKKKKGLANQAQRGPNDDRQNDGLDLSHYMLYLALDNKLFLAPIGDNLQKVIDIGTATGIWAM
ncbi:hypothetical protein ACJZ2D_005719 [Fusarium nematophilum]